MNINSTLLLLLCAPLTMIACAAAQSDGATSESEVAAAEAAINLNPATLEQAVESLTAIDALQKLDSARGLDALAKLAPKLDELNHLVARVETAPGHIIDFYETLPGIVNLSEQGRTGQASVLGSDALKGKSKTQLYQALAGGAAPPEALVRAQEREVVVAGRTELPQSHNGVTDETILHSGSELPSPNALSGENVGSTSQALTAADAIFWRDHVCFPQRTFIDHVVCLPNWHNGGSAEWTAAKTSYIQVAPFSGNVVSVRLKFEGEVRFASTVDQGNWKSWEWHSDTTCHSIFACGSGTGQDYNLRDHRWDILNAEGDGFHWTAGFKTTCADTLACDRPN